MFQIFKAIFGVKSKAAQGRIEAARNRAKSKSQPSAELGAERELRREREAHFALLAQVERSSRND